MKHYFSSDWHLGHAKIIEYDKRPFNSVEEMNATIIKNYNELVTLQDDFYFLGDFCMGDHNKAEAYLEQLIPNKKYFLPGNHDKRQTRELYKKYGTYLGNMAEVRINGKSITLCHYSMELWNKSHHGSWHLFGHSHGTLPDNPHRLSLDVGINCWDYKPVSFEEIEIKMLTKSFKPVDHHHGGTT